jgi:hypothetical protein
MARPRPKRADAGTERNHLPTERRSPAYLQEFVEGEIAGYAAIIKAAGIVPQ